MSETVGSALSRINVARSASSLLLYVAFRKRFLDLMNAIHPASRASTVRGKLQGWLWQGICAWIALKVSDLWMDWDLFGMLTSRFYIDSVHKEDDDSYAWLMSFWRDHPRYNNARTFLTEVTSGSLNRNHRGRHRRRHDYDNDIIMQKTPSLKEDVAPNFLPRIAATLYFRHKGVLFRFSHGVVYRDYDTRKKKYIVDEAGDTAISIRCFSRTRDPLIRLLTDARNSWEAKKPDMLTIRTYNPKNRYNDDAGWELAALKHHRTMDSIVMDEDSKAQLLRDARDFLANEEWYNKRGLPWMRGYCFWGPPGTGKTSTVQALASDLGIACYIVPIAGSDMDDSLLSLALRSVPPRSIVVFEDIDCIGIDQRDLPKKRLSAKDNVVQMRPIRRYAPPAPPFNSRPPPQVTLSGLLNCIDGLGVSIAGRILIMSTNDFSKLDEALIRPGRVDLRVEFRNATRAQAEQLFRAFYSDWTSSVSDANSAVPSSDVQAPNAASKVSGELKARPHTPSEIAEISRLAAKWASPLQERQFSMAALQNMLVRYRTDPHAAAENMPQWLAEQALERERQEKQADGTSDDVDSDSDSHSDSDSDTSSSEDTAPKTPAAPENLQKSVHAALHSVCQGGCITGSPHSYLHLAPGPKVPTADIGVDAGTQTVFETSFPKSMRDNATIA